MPIKKKPKLTKEQKKVAKVHNQIITMYGVVPTPALNEADEKAKKGASIDEQAQLLKIHTLVTTREEGFEYIREHIILNHKEHFIRWCELHSKDPSNVHVKDEYIDTCVDMCEKDNQYSIIDIKYTYADLGVILRISAGCVPIGCSFDSPAEIEEYAARQAFMKAAADAQNVIKNIKDSKEEPQPRKKPKQKAKKPSSGSKKLDKKE